MTHHEKNDRKKNARRSAWTSFLTAAGFAFVANLPENLEGVTVNLVVAAAYAGVRTGIVAINPNDDSYGRGK